MKTLKFSQYQKDTNVMNKTNESFDLFPLSHKDISPQEFLAIRDRTNIKSVEIVPPQIGKNHFGKIRIEFKIPLYNVGYKHGR